MHAEKEKWSLEVKAHCGISSRSFKQYGGERGIRTLDTLLTYTHFPGVLLQPLGHLTVFLEFFETSLYSKARHCISATMQLQACATGAADGLQETQKAQAKKSGQGLSRARLSAKN